VDSVSQFHARSLDFAKQPLQARQVLLVMAAQVMHETAQRYSTVTSNTAVRVSCSGPSPEI
jgi:hypothetical protein